MHPLHDDVAKQLADKLEDRRVVVWYDERRDFQPFVDELRGAPREGCAPVPMTVGGLAAKLVEGAGSLFEVHAAADHASAEPPSILKSIFLDAGGHDGPLTVWLVGDGRDAEIASKAATREMTRLVKSRLGLDLVVDAPPSPAPAPPPPTLPVTSPGPAPHNRAR